MSVETLELTKTEREELHRLKAFQVNVSSLPVDADSAHAKRLLVLSRREQVYELARRCGCDKPQQGIPVAIFVEMQARRFSDLSWIKDWRTK
jgi:hypothetical protein